MKEQLLRKLTRLKLLNGAYIASLEFDHCPDVSKIERVEELCDTGLTTEELTEALNEYSGERPDELVRKMSDVIKIIII